MRSENSADPCRRQTISSGALAPPLLGSFKKLLGSRKEAENALLLYRERFTETGIYENELYPGIATALSALKSSGRRMFVATSKPKAFADRIIEHFGLSPCPSSAADWLPADLPRSFQRNESL